MHFLATITSLILLSTTPGSWNCDVTAVVTSGEIVVDENTEEDTTTNDEAEEEKLEEKEDVSLEEDLSKESEQIEEKSDKTDSYEDLFVNQDDLDDISEDDFSEENTTVIIKPDVITDVIEENTEKSEESSDATFYTYSGEKPAEYEDTHTGYSETEQKGEDTSSEDIVESDDEIELPAEIVEIEDVVVPYFDRIFRHVLWIMNSSNYEREEDIPLPFVHRSEAVTIFTAGTFFVLMFAIFWFAYLKRKEEEKKQKSLEDDTTD